MVMVAGLADMAAIVVGKKRSVPGASTQELRWRLGGGVHLNIFGLIGRTLMRRQVRAVVVDPTAPGKLAIKPIELRDPDRDEVAVRVTAISLNRGETRRAVQQAEPGWRPGWDFVGVTETAAADGSGPSPGTRVVGILPSGAWAERVNCRTHAVAALPDAVGDEGWFRTEHMSYPYGVQIGVVRGRCRHRTGHGRALSACLRYRPVDQPDAGRGPAG